VQSGTIAVAASAFDFNVAPVASAAALILAAVLIWAAVAKLRTQPQTAKDFSSLGLQNPQTLARVVPVVELLVATLLVLQRQWGGVAATSLIVAFSTIIYRVLRNPAEFAAASCACFGGSSHATLSWRSMARNGVLLLLAVVAAFV